MLKDAALLTHLHWEDLRKTALVPEGQFCVNPTPVFATKTNSVLLRVLNASAVNAHFF